MFFQRIADSKHFATKGSAVMHTGVQKISHQFYSIVFTSYSWKVHFRTRCSRSKPSQTSLKVNSVLERESSQTILTSILSNNCRNIKSVKLSKGIKIRTNQFIFTKPEKIWCAKSQYIFCGFWKIYWLFVIYIFMQHPQQFSVLDKFQQDFRNNQILWKYDTSSSATPTTTQTTTT